MSGKIVHNNEAVIQAMEVGIVAFVMAEFKTKLADRFQETVDLVFEEMKKEMPEKIEAKVATAISDYEQKYGVEVVVDLRGFEK